MSFEHRSEPLLHRRAFLRRLTLSLGIGLAVIGGSLLIGMVGYHAFERLTWIDSFLNASMLLGGMGPVEEPQTAGGKIFAGLYSLYCGFVVLLVAGIVFAPVVHRLFHKFHIEKGGS